MSIELTPAAIDQASTRVRGLWHESRLPAAGGHEEEGLYSWLRRMAESALQAGEKLESGKIRFKGMKFTFLSAYSPRNGEWHILQGVERVK